MSVRVTEAEVATVVVAMVVVADMVVVAAAVAVMRADDIVEDGCLRQKAKFLEMCRVRVGASISTMWVVITVPGESLSLSYRNKLKEVAEGQLSGREMTGATIPTCANTQASSFTRRWMA